MERVVKTNCWQHLPSFRHTFVQISQILHQTNIKVQYYIKVARICCYFFGELEITFKCLRHPLLLTNKIIPNVKLVSFLIKDSRLST